MNVGSPVSTYKVTVVPPPRLTAKIEPSAMSFKAVGQKQEFVLTLSGAINGNGNVMSGYLVWDDGLNRGIIRRCWILLEWCATVVMGWKLVTDAVARGKGIALSSAVFHGNTIN
ncbi:hypothetical protein RHGRI_007958 [Rhododendron griersonianum]|uniref:Subtilisin-like protease fibronectin type-III domain-containing protein n=1 Tax=Rhododendron griersonianum TaxID=479676 RepID=A0AAV6L0S8_9ERIC|nr:hypothetical protein RHGRI_007958 [Rhododendron griersonianum]